MSRHEKESICSSTWITEHSPTRTAGLEGHHGYIKRVAWCVHRCRRHTLQAQNLSVCNKTKSALCNRVHRRGLRYSALMRIQLSKENDH